MFIENGKVIKITNMGEYGFVTILVRRKYADKEGNYNGDFLDFIASEKTITFMEKNTPNGTAIGFQGRVETAKEKETGYNKISLRLDQVSFLPKSSDESHDEEPKQASQPAEPASDFDFDSVKF